MEGGETHSGSTLGLSSHVTLGNAYPRSVSFPANLGIWNRCSSEIPKQGWYDRGCTSGCTWQPPMTPWQMERAGEGASQEAVTGSQVGGSDAGRCGAGGMDASDLGRKQSFKINNKQTRLSKGPYPVTSCRRERPRSHEGVLGTRHVDSCFPPQMCSLPGRVAMRGLLHRERVALTGSSCTPTFCPVEAHNYPRHRTAAFKPQHWVLGINP